jgi:hypothetical protein
VRCGQRRPAPWPRCVATILWGRADDPAGGRPTA